MELISQIESRLKDQDAASFGKILQDVHVLQLEEESEDKVVNGARNSGNTSGGAAASTSGASLSGGFSRGQTRGNNRRRTPSQSNEELDTAIADRASGRSGATVPDEDVNGTILPGVEMLGVGRKADLIERAKKSGVDVMLMFNVKITKTRGNYFNSSSLKVVDVKTEENVFSSATLRDDKVAEAVDDGDNPVKDEIKKAFGSVVDKKFVAAELPSALNTENVKKRIGRLLKEEFSSPLRAAVEVVSYHQADLLDDDLAKLALKRLFGSDDSEILITGTSEERLGYLKQWLPDDFEQ